MLLKLAISPCPNDVFMFEAIINQRIPLRDYAFDVSYHDISTLNELAASGHESFDLIKLSCYNYFSVIDSYTMLRAGAALGFGVGPVLIARKDHDIDLAAMQKYIVALPGKTTTANFMFSHIYPNVKAKLFMSFNAIADSVLAGEADLGVLIHEGRFTYQQKGLKQLVDLGTQWEEAYRLPIPLGCIAARRSHTSEVLTALNSLIKNSIEYAFHNPEVAMPFIRGHAQELDDDVIKQHIKLYVNSFSLDLGAQGERALKLMRAMAFPDRDPASSGGELATTI